MSIMGGMNITQRAREAREASRRILSVSAESRSSALKSVRLALISRSEEIFAANKIDMDRSADEGLAPPMLKRLKFDETKLNRVCEGIRSLELAEDPTIICLQKHQYPHLS